MRRGTLRGFGVAAALGLAVVLGGVANATPVKIAGNDCMPDTDQSAKGGTVRGGGGIETCTLNDSPFIIKFDFQDDGMIKPTLGSFSSITGDEFSFNIGSEVENGKTEWAKTGTWLYTPDDASDPLITGWIAKGGPNYFVYALGGFTGTFNIDKGLSHLTFFDTERPTTPIPLPAAAWMMLAGLAGLGALGRRRSAAA